MTDESIETGIAHASFTLVREFAAPVERVFACFAEGERKQRWFAGDVRAGMEVLEYTFGFGVGERERARYRTAPDSPLRGAELTNETCYLDVVENERIVMAYSMAVGTYRISASLASFTLMKTAAGTRLVLHEQSAFFPNSDGVDRRRAGWAKLLEALEREVARKATVDSLQE